MFERTVENEGGLLTMSISFENIPLKTLMDSMDSIQEMSNELLNDEIPNHMIGGVAVK